MMMITWMLPRSSLYSAFVVINIIIIHHHHCHVNNALISFQYAFPWGQETVDSMIVISDLHQHMATKQCSELPYSEESKLHVIQIKTDLNRGIRKCPG